MVTVLCVVLYLSVLSNSCWMKIAHAAHPLYEHKCILSLHKVHWLSHVLTVSS